MQYERLLGVLRENALGTHDITYADHHEKSLCSDNDPPCQSCEIKIIYLDWIAQLHRLLIQNMHENPPCLWRINDRSLITWSFLILHWKTTSIFLVYASPFYFDLWETDHRLIKGYEMLSVYGWILSDLFVEIVNLIRALAFYGQ